MSGGNSRVVPICYSVVTVQAVRVNYCIVGSPLHTVNTEHDFRDDKGLFEFSM